MSTTIATKTHYVDPFGSVWCPSIKDWTGEEFTNAAKGASADGAQGPAQSQCPECLTLLEESQIEQAHHADIDGQWYCQGEPASIFTVYTREEIIGDRCETCKEYVL